MNELLMIIDPDTNDVMHIFDSNDSCQAALGLDDELHRCGACAGCLTFEAIEQGFIAKIVPGFVDMNTKRKMREH